MGNLRQATNDEVANWHDLLTTNPAGGETLQTRALAAIKSRRGWQPEFMVYETSFGNVYTLFLVKKIPQIGRIIYVSRGPGVATIEQWREICRINRRFLRDATLIKTEPPILKPSVKILPDDLRKVNDIQKHLTNTIILNIDREEAEILASFRQRARRSIRGGKREMLRVVDMGFSQEAVDDMWRLYSATARRAKLKTRSKKYYRDYWRRFCEHNLGRFFFVYAPDDQRPIAGAFVCYIGDYALYKDGGSRRDTNKHFSHLLHWRIMQWLRERGIKKYDLDGTPPSDRLNDPTHRLYSLATFKMSFGGTVTDFVGAHDQILNQENYVRWHKIERLARAVLTRTSRRGLY